MAALYIKQKNLNLNRGWDTQSELATMNLNTVAKI